MNPDVIMCLACLGLMLLDVVTGYCGALKDGEVSSSKFREGLWKKLGSIFVILLAEAVQYGGIYIGIDPIVCDAIGIGVCGMVAVQEVTSVLENACVLNPDLPMAKLFAMFGMDESDGEVE